MRVLSIAVCMSMAALSFGGCAEEEASLLPDGGPITGAVRDGGADAATAPALVGIDSGTPVAQGTPATLPVNNGAGDESSWVKFPLDGGAPNPAASIVGNAVAVAIDGGMRVTLNVEGLPAAQTFGTHLHKLACTDMRGGPHYQNTPSPTTPTDPAFANPTNEVWLDLATDAEGRATANSSVAWVPRKGEAKSIVVHAQPTGDGGVAGDRLACTPMPF